MSKYFLHSVTGPVSESDLGLILPHEHLFTDLRGPQTPDYAQAEASHVVQVVQPFLAQAEAAGVTALVECSTQGVGRNVAVLQHLAERTSIRIVAPTGVYREAFVPTALREARAEDLGEAWIRDLEEGIEGSRVQAGFIKIAMSDDGPTDLEVRNLKAAARASRSTGAGIASHTVKGTVARREMDILEGEGLDLGRFVWVHANAEPDQSYHLEAAHRGAFVELDAVGASPQDDERILADTLKLLEAGYAGQILLSHDAGWYQPGNPGGLPEGGYRGYTWLSESFIPRLKASGVSAETVHLLTHSNPLRAFGFSST